jgi:hypothetical protein
MALIALGNPVATVDLSERAEGGAREALDAPPTALNAKRD